jgi:predicted permease
MKAFPGLRQFFRLGAFRADPKEDLDAELDFHFGETQREFLESGMSPAEAREEALRRFGDLSSYRRKLAAIDRKQATRTRRKERFSNLRQDLGYALRGMRRNPGFTLGVVLTLALGIGANATMFGVVDRILLTPPAHVEAPDEVVRLQVHRMSPFTGQPGIMAYQTFSDYRDFLEAGSFEAVAAFGDQDVILGRGEEAERIRAQYSTASIFPLLGVRPALGRFFDEEEAEPGAPGVVVLGHGLWQRRYGGSRDVLGKVLAIGDGTFTVIGVTPPRFNGVDLAPVDLFLPVHAFTVFLGDDRWVENRGFYWLQAIGRLGPHSSPVAAAEEVTALHLNGRRELIDGGRYSEDARIVLGSVKAALGPDAPDEVRVSRWLVGVTVIVLLIACANVANLLLARGARRQRELGIRVAMGISRRRLVGQLLLESILLAGLGGAVGLALGYGGGHLMRSTFLPQVAWFGSPISTRVLLFTLVLAGSTGLLAGIAPALKGSHGRIVQSLRDGGRGGTTRRSRSQTFLLLTQAALSVILLAGAGLFVRSLARAHSLDLGIEPEGLVVAELELDGEWEPEAVLDLSRRAAERLETLPGVQGASFASGIPFRGMMAFDVWAQGMDSLPVARGLGPFFTTVSPDHLETLGIELRAGRMFTAPEAATGARVTLVTENMAQGTWGGEAALGQCLLIQDREGPCWEVVGIVENSNLTRLTGETPWQHYLPLGAPALELGAGPRALFIRTRGDASSLLAPVRRELQSLDSRIRFAYVRLQQDLVDPELRSWKLGATMFSLFGILALVVASVGLYSVLAFNVTRRVRELGVRSAVGASRGHLVGMVLREATGVLGLGVLLGLILATSAASNLGPLLFETSPRDPMVLASVSLLLLLVGLVASAIPAWTASRVDPMTALRTE